MYTDVDFTSDKPPTHVTVNSNTSKVTWARRPHFGNYACTWGALRTATHRLTTGIRSEKRVVRCFCRSANILGCSYTHQDHTPRPYGRAYCSAREENSFSLYPSRSLAGITHPCNKRDEQEKN